MKENKNCLTAKKAQTSFTSSHLNGLFLYAESTVTVNAYHETIHYKPLITRDGCYSRDKQVYFHYSFYAFSFSYLLFPSCTEQGQYRHQHQAQPCSNTRGSGTGGSWMDAASVQQPSHGASPPAKNALRPPLPIISHFHEGADPSLLTKFFSWVKLILVLPSLYISNTTWPHFHTWTIAPNPFFLPVTCSHPTIKRNGTEVLHVIPKFLTSKHQLRFPSSCNACLLHLKVYLKAHKITYS